MPTPPIENDGDEDLVAYLDGELADAEAHAIESKLAADEEARRKAERLRKTFDLLDYLPKSEPSPNFASRTLTQIAPLEVGPTTTTGSPSTSAPLAAAGRARPRLSARTVGLWAAVLLVAAVAGYFGHLLARPHLEATDPAKRTSEQVRLLERLPLLLGVDDFEFVKQLDQADFFGEADHDDGGPRAATETRTSAELEQLENQFKKFPLSRQHQLRKLDEELSRQVPERQTHLTAVLERYAVWLDRLPDAYRREILTAPAAVERLELIRVVKARRWRESLPVAVRERIQNADGPAREQLVAERKQQDADRKLLWDRAKEHWSSIRTGRRPWPFDNEGLTRQVEDYVEKVLKPRLTVGERAELEQVRDQVRKETAINLDWYLFGHHVTRLVDLHPMYPEAAIGKVVKTKDDLPRVFLQQIAKSSGAGRKQLNNHPASGKWPDFAEAVWKEANELKVPIPASVVLGPNKPAEYGPAVREFLDKELSKQLTKAERDELARAEHGSWPDHSRKLIELARKYDLSVPGVSPPGEPSKWDQGYRNRPARR